MQPTEPQQQQTHKWRTAAAAPQMVIKEMASNTVNLHINKPKTTHSTAN
jgi:hypothetical protein